MAEEAVVERRDVPKDEVVVREPAVTETETMETDARGERIDVDKHGAVERTRGDEPRAR